MDDLKKVYKAANVQEAEKNLEEFEEKWTKRYSVVVESWKNNWHKLSTYFDYPEGIRRLIYTTNTIEGYHRQIRKVTKTKGAFQNDMALLKLVYLASEDISERWTRPIADWPLISQHLKIIFGGRMPTT